MINELVKALKEVQRERCYTIDFTADILKISRSHLYRLYNGERQPSADLIERILSLIGDDLPGDFFSY